MTNIKAQMSNKAKMTNDKRKDYPDLDVHALFEFKAFDIQLTFVL
jgi:hypothetical protein